MERAGTFTSPRIPLFSISFSVRLLTFLFCLVELQFKDESLEIKIDDQTNVLKILRITPLTPGAVRLKQWSNVNIEGIVGVSVAR